MEQNRKRQIVKQLREELGDVNSIFLCNFNGLTVEADTDLRKKMRENGAKYEVVKNTLLKLAFTDTDLAQVNDHLVGNTALAHNKDDLVGLAKLIRDFAKDNKKFQFKAGVVEGKVIDASDLEGLAEMPSKEELIGKLMFMLNYPIQGFVTALAGVNRNLVVVLDQIRQQKEGQ
jgi:large subunit ribosomal protein L10